MYHIPFYVCLRYWAKFVRILPYLVYIQLTESLTEQVCFPDRLWTLCLPGLSYKWRNSFEVNKGTDKHHLVSGIRHELSANYIECHVEVDMNILVYSVVLKITNKYKSLYISCIVESKKQSVLPICSVTNYVWGNYLVKGRPLPV